VFSLLGVYTLNPDSTNLGEPQTSYHRPVLYVGDHGQLEPVSNDRGFGLLARPDVTLETIHRNAGEVAHFADFVRKGHTPTDWRRQPGHTGGVLCGVRGVGAVDVARR
jgi:hypothetical protein